LDEVENQLHRALVAVVFARRAVGDGSVFVAWQAEKGMSESSQ